MEQEVFYQDKRQMMQVQVSRGIVSLRISESAAEDMSEDSEYREPPAEERAVRRQRASRGSGNPKNKRARKRNAPQFQRWMKANKLYNLIDKHFCLLKLLIRLKFANKFDAFQLLEAPEGSMTDAVIQILNEETFPSFQDFKASKVDIGLHANSFHYVLAKLKKQGKSRFSESEIRQIFNIYLSENGLLTKDLLIYLDDYWENIIELIRNPNGVQQENPEPHEDNWRNVSVQNLHESNPQHEDPREPRLSEKDKLIQNLSRDPSLLAYHVGCYLYFACQREQIRID